jgi:hypothetical protein
MKSFTSRPPVRQSPNLTPRSAACLPAGLEIGIPKTNEAASSWPAVARSSNSQPCHLLFSFVILSGAKDLMLPKLDFITNNCDSRHRFQTLSTRQWWSEIQSRGVPVFKDGSRRSSLTTESKGNSKTGCPIHRALCDEWDSTAASFQGSRPGFASRAIKSSRHPERGEGPHAPQNHHFRSEAEPHYKVQNGKNCRECRP